MLIRTPRKTQRFRLFISFSIALGLHLLLFFFLIMTVQFNRVTSTLMTGPKIIQATALLASSRQPKIVDAEKLPFIKKSLPTPKQIAELKSNHVKVAIQKQAKAKRVDEQKRQLEATRQLEAKQQQAAKLAQDQELALQESLVAEQQAASSHAQAMQGIVDHYKLLMQQAIAQNWFVPPASDSTLFAQLLLRLAPDGTVIEVKLSKSSGDLALDQSALTAVQKSSPLPVPNDLQLFKEFREIKLTVRPEMANQG